MMSTNHEQIALFLPWHLNGTLSASEASQVKQHIETCLLCHKELDQLRLAQISVTNSDPFSNTPELSFAKISSALNTPSTYNQKKRAIQFKSVFDEILFQIKNLMSYQLLWALPALMLAFMLIQLPITNTPQFRTLTSSPNTILTATETIRLKVMFDQKMSLLEFQKSLAEMNAEIINGPSEIGIYILDVPKGDLKNYPLNKLRQLNQILFAEIDAE